MYSNLGHIEDIVVNKSHRGKGIGKAIVQKLIDIGKEKGCYKTVINCKKELLPFYQKTNLKRTGYELSVHY